jgi:hypothetical protein
VARTLQHAKVRAPRPNRLAVLVGHNPRNLVQVSQVVRHPASEVLRQFHRPERGVPSPPLEILWPQIHRAQLVQTFGAPPRKFIQQVGKRLTLAQLYVPFAIKRLKRPRLAGLQNDSRPRNPVRLFAINQVRDNVEHVPCVPTLISVGPLFGQFAQERIQRTRSTSKKRNGLL